MESASDAIASAAVPARPDDAASLIAELAAVWEKLSRVPAFDREKAADKNRKLPDAVRALVEAGDMADAVREPLNLHPSWRKRLDATLSGVKQVREPDIIREGIARVVDEYEATGSIRFGVRALKPATGRQSAATGTTAAKVENAALLTLAGLEKHPDRRTREEATRLARRFLESGTACQCHAAAEKPRLTVSAKHERMIRKYARFLEVSPEDFLTWNLSDDIEPLDDAQEGLLGTWVCELIKYATPEAEARVKARHAKWEFARLGKNLKHGSEA